ncbi:MAG: holdfast anchor protein HfaD, partial [Caulobacteraceae bacterium]
IMNTEAVANAATSTATNGSADGYYVQQSLGPLIHAGTLIDGDRAGANYLSASTQGIGNTIGIGTDNARNDAVIHQTNNASVEGATGGAIHYVPNSVSFSGTAIANNVTASGVNGSAMNIEANQTTSGDHIQGTSFLSAGNVQSASGAATATANNMSVNNQGGPLAVQANQVNNSYIRAESVVSPSLFGSATSVAYGVGNSVLAGEYGDSLSLANTQENTGARIDAIATGNGGEGYDMSAQATAMGNAVTGFACSECGGVIDVNNDQRNASGVHATTTVTTTGTNRSTQAITTAVGNSATFYVTKPGG